MEGSAYYQSPLLYKENGFKKEEDAKALIHKLKAMEPQEAELVSIERKKETRMRRFYLTWQSFRMSVPSGSRSVRMRH